MKLVSTFYLLMTLMLLVSCKQEPKPIDYGVDACHFCRMTIVDKIHGAEMVTDKGKIFKFDAAECLFRYMNDIEVGEKHLFLTNHFENPGELIPMKEAMYLQSENLPSPMGAFLTAFRSKQKAIEIREEKGGVISTFLEMKEKFKD